MALGNITWSHAVNSPQRLAKYINDPETMFLEFDISVSNDGQAIAAHPPVHESDLSFEEVLIAAKKTKQGIKLDFKDPEILVDCLKQLQAADLKQPLIINADVLPGTNALRPKFTAPAFIALTKYYLPEAVLSLGWTTNDHDPYTPDQVQAMLDLCQGLTTELTFPVRASLLPNSWEILQPLLAKPNHSLSIWNNEDFDNDWLRTHLDPKKCYIDLIVMEEGLNKFDPLRDFNK